MQETRLETQHRWAMRMAKNAGVFLWGGKQLIQSPKLGFKLLGSFVAFLCLLTWPMMRLVRDTGEGLFGHKQMRGPLAGVYVRVIVRAHPKDADLLKSLVWNLRHQAKTAGIKVDFTLVPTEPDTWDELHDLAEALTEPSAVGLGDTHVLELSNEFFILNDNPKFRCTPAHFESFEMAGKAPLYIQKLCGYNNYIYYRATDEALTETVTSCQHCTHVLVTNADNSYAPTFFAATLENKQDIIVTDFAHQSGSMVAQMRRGGLDLGGVIFKKSVLQKGKHTFLTSLPPDAGPTEAHDADWWFVFQAVSKHGATYKLLHQLLFYHH